jgi:hypothetical protein
MQVRLLPACLHACRADCLLPAYRSFEGVPLLPLVKQPAAAR